MKITCPYCGNLFESSNAQCPHCLAPNDQSPETTDGSPSTIDELRRWYSNRHLPPYEVTRFFIGENVSEPRAFGIYREGDRVIVYKNKDNDQRAIRYNGTDEGYAVSEFLNKLKDELLHQKQQSFAVKDDLPTTTLPQSQSVPFTQQNAAPTVNRRGCLTKILIVLAVLLLLSLIFGRGSSSPAQGYYDYNGSNYYYAEEDDNWYSYQNGQWSYVPNVPSGLFNNSGSYYSGSTYNSNYYFDDFDDYNGGFFSENYDPDYSFSQGSQWDSSSSSSQWDSSSSSSSWSSNDDDDDWDWGGSDSWDSGYTDWDSDW